MSTSFNTNDLDEIKQLWLNRSESIMKNPGLRKLYAKRSERLISKKIAEFIHESKIEK